MGPYYHLLRKITLNETSILLIGKSADRVPAEHAQRQLHVRVWEIVRLLGPALLPGRRRLLAEHALDLDLILKDDLRRADPDVLLENVLAGVLTTHYYFRHILFAVPTAISAAQLRRLGEGGIEPIRVAGCTALVVALGRERLAVRSLCEPSLIVRNRRGRDGVEVALGVTLTLVRVNAAPDRLDLGAHAGVPRRGRPVRLVDVVGHENVPHGVIHSRHSHGVAKGAWDARVALSRAELAVGNHTGDVHVIKDRENQDTEGEHTRIPVDEVDYARAVNDEARRGRDALTGRLPRGRPKLEKLVGLKHLQRIHSITYLDDFFLR
ncbi:hypothetical protein [Yellowstone lake phycodnavirus 3]|uniref:hypothetical protein n=1 Tax=Yellowstone lake phycodnavirus 3 TaxID=1586715 RepID=UPI0006EB9C09|nr:hypothetical protein AR677_gp144 [Yellowstone lake phycodnavirus 3]BAT22643.1 hypothetical protein [Yellowstone lake phycodnavirus 3]